MSDTDPTATLAQLSTSLTALETALEPLLAKPLEEHLAAAQDEPLVQARMQVLASYVVHDLIWVYLKAAGVEPSTHPVMEEIERLKGYFGKLKQAEGGAPPAAEASKPRMQVDRAAANRFISAAINSGKASVDPSYTDVDGDSAEAGPSGTHIRFEEEEVDRLLEDKDEEDSEEAGEIEGELQTEKVENESGAKGKGKEGTPAKGGKPEKKRRAIDPFAGYDQPKPSTPSASSKKTSAKSASTSSTSTPAASTPQPPSSSAKRKRWDTVEGAGGGTPSGSATPTGDGSKKSKKKLKMKGEKAGK
ncbi:hypothetical protein JCM11251_005417 [Rhodosporidiobolus azoricus]